MNNLVTASLGTRNAIAISRVSRWNPFIHYSVILCLNLTSLVLSMTLWVGHRGRALSSTLYRTAAHLLTPAIIAKGFIGPDLRSSLHLIHAAPWSDKLFLLIGGLLYVTLLKEVAGGLKSFERTDADYVQLAESLSFEGHFDEAEEVLAKVSNTTRFSEWARVPILLSRGELEAAEYCTKRALEFDPKNRHIPTSEDIFFNLHHLASSYPIPALCCLQLWQLSVERQLREALLFQFSTYLLFAEDHQIDKKAVFERKAAQAPRLPTANYLAEQGHTYEAQVLLDGVNWSNEAERLAAGFIRIKCNIIDDSRDENRTPYPPERAGSDVAHLESLFTTLAAGRKWEAHLAVSLLNSIQRRLSESPHLSAVDLSSIITRCEKIFCKTTGLEATYLRREWKKSTARIAQARSR